MEMIALMLSGLALLAAGVCLCLLMREKKRNQERKAVLLDFIHAEVKAAVNEAVKAADSPERMEAVRKAAEEIVAQAVDNVCEKISGAYTGNNFGLGINSIMNYDPHAALAVQRERERQGE